MVVRWVIALIAILAVAAVLFLVVSSVVDGGGGY